MSADNPQDQINENDSDAIEEGEIDFSKLTAKEKEDLILEMHAEEMREKRKAEEQKASTSTTAKKKKKKRVKQKSPSGAEIAPGFGWVVVKMGAALAFSMAFILIGPIILFMSFFGYYSKHSQFTWWIDLVMALIGVGLTIAAWYLFRYIIKD